MKKCPYCERVATLKGFSCGTTKVDAKFKRSQNCRSYELNALRKNSSKLLRACTKNVTELNDRWQAKNAVLEAQLILINEVIGYISDESDIHMSITKIIGNTPDAEVLTGYRLIDSKDILMKKPRAPYTEVQVVVVTESE